MDRWQLTHLSLSLVLPLRPEEAAGLLVGDVDFEKGWLVIGTRLAGDDFTKGGTSFKLPFPDEQRPILRACIDGRSNGPLLRGRRVYDGRSKARRLAKQDDLTRLYERRLLQASPGSVQARQDRKLVFRRLLRELGGVSQDEMAREFKRVMAAIGVLNGSTFYTLRSSVTTGMKDANLPHLGDALPDKPQHRRHPQPIRVARPRPRDEPVLRHDPTTPPRHPGASRGPGPHRLLRPIVAADPLASTRRPRPAHPRRPLPIFGPLPRSWIVHWVAAERASDLVHGWCTIGAHRVES